MNLKLLYLFPEPYICFETATGADYGTLSDLVRKYEKNDDYDTLFYIINDTMREIRRIYNDNRCATDIILMNDENKALDFIKKYTNQSKKIYIISIFIEKK